MPPITVEMHKRKIKNKDYDHEYIRDLIKRGTLNDDELVNEGILTSDELNKILQISPTEHMNNIRMGLYSDEKIMQYLQSGSINEVEVVKQGVLSQTEVDQILKRPMAPISINFDLRDVPPLQQNRVDVFVFGIAGSGKSSFMAGLIYYVWKSGRLKTTIENVSGFTYVQSLINAVRNKLLPPATPLQYVQYMACDFIDQEERAHPLTFIEMSGELFQQCFGVPKDAMPAKVKEYLFDSPNNKIIFLTVDYNKHKSGRFLDITQEARFDFILQILEINGTLDTTEAICLLITKWDISRDSSDAAVQKFAEEEYLGLVRLCKSYQEKYKLKFEVFTFSLGDFDERNSYVYNDRDSSYLYKWLCSFSSTVKKQPKRRWGF